MAFNGYFYLLLVGYVCVPCYFVDLILYRIVYYVLCPLFYRGGFFFPKVSLLIWRMVVLFHTYTWQVTLLFLSLAVFILPWEPNPQFHIFYASTLPMSYTPVTSVFYFIFKMESHWVKLWFSCLSLVSRCDSTGLSLGLALPCVF